MPQLAPRGVKRAETGPKWSNRIKQRKKQQRQKGQPGSNKIEKGHSGYEKGRVQRDTEGQRRPNGSKQYTTRLEGLQNGEKVKRRYKEQKQVDMGEQKNRDRGRKGETRATGDEKGARGKLGEEGRKGVDKGEKGRTGDAERPKGAKRVKEGERGGKGEKRGEKGQARAKRVNKLENKVHKGDNMGTRVRKGETLKGQKRATGATQSARHGKMWKAVKRVEKE